MKLEEKRISKEKKNKIQNLITRKKPLFGNNRSFSCNSTRKKWAINLQNFTIEGKNYRISSKNFRSISKILKEKL